MILNPAIDSGNPCRRGWELMIANHGKLGFTDAIEAATDKAKMGSDPREEGLGWRRRAVLDALLLPRDARGIVLPCGLLAAASPLVRVVPFLPPLAYPLLPGAPPACFLLSTRAPPSR